MSLTNVVADSPNTMSVTSSDATLTLKGTNIPLTATADNRNVLIGTPTQAVDGSKVLDCSRAFVDFPAIGASNLFGSSWAAQ
jgi:hypothetical protein